MLVRATVSAVAKKAGGYRDWKRNRSSQSKGQHPRPSYRQSRSTANANQARRHSGSSRANSSSAKTKAQFNTHMANYGIASLFTLGIGYVVYGLWKDNVKQPVIAESVLKNEKTAGESTCYVVDDAILNLASAHVTVGRSRGHKDVIHRVDGVDEFYFYKKPFSRELLLNELVAGALGHHLFGKVFPKVYAVEKRIDDTYSEYSFISQSLSGSRKNDNLETWVQLYSEDLEELKFGPRRLGCAIAFDMLLGKTDCKLANLVLMRGKKGFCYSIDHESGFRLSPQFLTDKEQGLAFIGEYNKKSFQDRVQAEQTGIDKMNPHQPLTDEPGILHYAESSLQAAIETDLADGSVMEFYKRFANMTENEITNVAFARYGSLISKEEQSKYLADIKQRQEAARKFVLQQQNVAAVKETPLWFGMFAAANAGKAKPENSEFVSKKIP